MTLNKYFFSFIFLLASAAAGGVDNAAGEQTEDLHVKCKAWSFLGECELNAGYMLKNCPVSCRLYEEALASTTPKDIYR